MQATLQGLATSLEEVVHPDICWILCARWMRGEALSCRLRWQSMPRSWQASTGGMCLVRMGCRGMRHHLHLLFRMRLPATPARQGLCPCLAPWPTPHNLGNAWRPAAQRLHACRDVEMREGACEAQEPVSSALDTYTLCCKSAVAVHPTVAATGRGPAQAAQEARL